MPDYLLSAEWKKALKNQPDVKGADDLTKVLENHARSQDSPEKELVALKAVTAKAKDLKGKNSKNKVLADYLDDVLGAAEKAQREAEKAVAKAEKEEEDEEADIDVLLVKQLVVTRTLDQEKARHFVIALGKPSGVAISKVPIARKQKEQAREWRKGKGKLLIGLCYGEGGRLVFELESKPPGGLAVLIKKAVKLQARKDIKLKVRGGGVDIDDDDDLAEMAELGEDSPDEPDPVGTVEEEEEEEEAAAEVEPPPSGMAEFSQQARAVKERLDRLKARNADRWSPLNARYLGALASAQARQFEPARVLLTELLPQVDEALDAAPAVDDNGDAARFDARLKDLLQRAARLGLSADAAKDVKLLASEANVLGKKKDFGAAGSRLDALEAKLNPTPTGNGTAADPKTLARADALAKQLDDLARESGDAVAPVRQQLASARASAQAGRTVEAEEALDVVEARARGLGRAAQAAREIAAAGPTRTVGFRVAREGWNQARQIARVQMAKFSTAILTDAQAQAQPEWPDIEAGALDLVPMLDVFDDSLSKAIADAEETTDPALLRKHLQKAVSLIVEYRQELSTNPIYGVMDNGAYGTYKVHELISKSLDQAAAKLGV